MSKEAVYPCRVRFADEGPTLEEQIVLLLRDRVKEGSAEWTARR